MGYAGALVAALIATGCYSPSARDCSYACEHGACPSGLHCVNDFCREDPMAQDLCTPGPRPDDGGGGDAAANYTTLVLSDEPVAYWRLGDMQGAATAKNEIDPTVTGARTGMVMFGFQGALVGDPDTAAHFSPANNDCLVVGDAPALKFTATQPFTIEAWILLQSVTASIPRMVTGKITGAANPAGYSLEIDVSGAPRFRTDNGASVQGSFVVASSTLLAGQWIHLVGTYDGEVPPTLRLYVDGSEAGFIAAMNPPIDTTASFAIGCRASGSLNFDGAIDEVAIYNSVLTTARVHEHYLRGRAL